MKILGLLGLLLFVFSCQDSNPIGRTLHYPVCIDSINVEPHILTYEDLEEKLRFPILYIGEEKDTLFIDYKLGLSLVMAPPLPPPPPPFNTSKIDLIEDTVTYDETTEKQDIWSERRKKFAPYWCAWYELMGNYKHVIRDSMIVNVIVDTNRYLLHYDNVPIPKESCKAHPVIIKNIGRDTLVIATHDYIELVLEGQIKGTWKPLTEPFRHRGCGNGLTYLLLPPNEILVTSIPVYRWKESMQLRLKLGDNYSATFKGNTIVE